MDRYGTILVYGDALWMGLTPALYRGSAQGNLCMHESEEICAEINGRLKMLLLDFRYTPLVVVPYLSHLAPKSQMNLLTSATVSNLSQGELQPKAVPKTITPVPVLG